MKVIREGEDSENNWKVEITCHECKSLLEIIAEDVKYWGGSGTDYGPEPGFYVDCAVCKAQPDITDERKIPKAIRDRATEIWNNRQRNR